jgi:hypothetical protein
VTGDQDGTLYYDNFPNILDQFLVNKRMATQNAAVRAVPGSVEILDFPEMVGGGDYPKPIRFGGVGRTTLNENGFSDHFPIGMQVIEAD